MIEELNGDFLQWLRGFYHIAKCGSLRKAAEIMHRNPSTISYQLRSLEQELGTVLFDRCKKSLRITREGEKLLEWTITTFEALQGMRSAVGMVDGKLQGEICFASTLPFASLAVEPIARFRNAHPQVNINIIRALSADVITAVRESQVDFGLLGVIRDQAECPLEVLFKSRPVLVVRKDNPWCIPPVPTMTDLQRLPHISFLKSAGQAEDPYYELTQPLQPSSHTVITVNNYHLMLRFVLHGQGVAIMDELCLSGALYGEEWSSLRSYPLDHILPNMLYGIQVRRHKYLSPQAGALINVLREHFASLTADSLFSQLHGDRAVVQKTKAGRAKRPAESVDKVIATKNQE